MKQLKAIVLGAGNRGRVYANYALQFPGELEIVAVAEPDKERRNFFVKKYAIQPEYIYTDWEDVMALPKFADIVFVCTQDRMHVEPAIAAMKAGYDLLLEKPIALNLEDCNTLLEAKEKYNATVAVAHVLRYTPFFSLLKKLIKSGAIGEIKGVQHNENIGHIHYSHSYVRGNWSNVDTSSPVLLAKSCHDMDILLYLIGSDCKNISSFGSRSYFMDKNKPKDSPPFCMDGCRHSKGCPYYAPKIYLTDDYEWKNKIIPPGASQESISERIKKGPYGRCVFSCDNNGIENQTINIEFENSVSAVFTMSAFTAETSRTIKILGDRGELRGHMEKNEIEIYNFSDRSLVSYQVDSMSSGHGGGDISIIRNLVSYLNGLEDELDSTLEKSIQSHKMVYAAEDARINHTVVSLK